MEEGNEGEILVEIHGWETETVSLRSRCWERASCGRSCASPLGHFSSRPCRSFQEDVREAETRVSPL